MPTKAPGHKAPGKDILNLISLDDLTTQNILDIWALAKQPPAHIEGNVGWSFEGNGIRTRTTFIQAFRQLGLDYIELPNFLKTRERPCDLAGYLDPFYSLYVIRESSHEKLQAFASASKRPVINAMSAVGHPCEVLSDGFYLHSRFGDIRNIKVGLWGPTTNVMNSWHELAQSLEMVVHHFCSEEFHQEKPHVIFSACADAKIDVLFTDSWPAGYSDTKWSLTEKHLTSLGNPVLLPTPPFYVGEEINFDPVHYSGFAGYEQKRFLLQVQRAVIAYVMGIKHH